jgi:hypothetical protein
MRRLSGQDAYCLYRETPSVLMHTLKLAVCDPPDPQSTPEQLRDNIEKHLHLLPPLRRRLGDREQTSGPGSPALGRDGTQLHDLELLRSMYVGAIACRDAVPDLHELCNLLHLELSALQQAASVQG